ncbi:MAG: rRNA maturation RNase YbeY [Salinibacter sp.]
MDDAYATPLSIQQVHPSLELQQEALEQLIHHVIDAEDGQLVHLSVVLTGHETVRSLNASYLDHDYDTDVLSFSLRHEPKDEENIVEGEIYIDLDTAAERHADFNATFEAEARRYVVHGLLHLLGYDDQSPSGQDTMRALEDQYLDAMPPVSE